MLTSHALARMPRLSHPRFVLAYLPGAAFGITNQNEFSSRHVDAYEYTFADFYDGTFFKDDIGLIAFPSEILDAPAVQLSPFPASQLDKTPLYTAGGAC